jgi:hypothetical protein
MKRRLKERGRYQAVRWGVDAILTDMTKTWLDLRAALDGTHGSQLYLPRRVIWN